MIPKYQITLQEGNKETFLLLDPTMWDWIQDPFGTNCPDCIDLALWSQNRINWSSKDELIDYFISATMTEKVVMIKNIVEERFAGESALITYILENDIDVLQRKEYQV